MIVRELIAKLGIDLDKASVSRADRAMGSIKKAVIGIGAAFAAAKVGQSLVGLVTNTVRAGDEIDKVSQKLGVGASALQEFRHAANLTGVGQKTLDLALQRFTRRAAEAAQGTGEAKDALRQLGVRLRDSNGQLRPTEDLLGDVAEGMRRTGSDGDRLRLAFKLFDSEGAALVNTLKGGKDALDGMRLEARELGGVLNEDLIANSVELNDNMARFGLLMQGLKNVIAGAIIPRVNQIVEGFIAWRRANAGIFNQKLTEFADNLATVFGVLWDIMKAVGRVFFEAVNWFGSLTTRTKMLLIPLGVLLTYLAAPGILIAALIAGLFILIEDFIVFAKGGESATGRVWEAFKSLWANIKEGFLGIFPSIGETLSTAIDFWMDILQGFFNWWFDLIASVPGRIFDTLKGLGGSAFSAITGALGIGQGLTPSVRPSPVAAAAANHIGGSTFNMEMTVNGAPGQDEGAIADKTAKKVQAMLESQFSDAYAAHVPAAG